MRALEGVPVECVTGDITDSVENLQQQMKGCDWCFHVAANYSLWMKDYTPMYRANVGGTHRVIEAAWRAGCTRIVYTSTVGCIGLPSLSPGMPVEPTDEQTPVAEAQMSNHYKLSKWKAEQVALELVSKGAPVVIVNPSAPIGGWDIKPTPTGKIVVDFLNRAMPAFLDTGLNFVHVRDVAAGHRLAAEKGRIGQRYILGNADGNWTMQQALQELEKLTGIPAPRHRVPYPVALGFAHLNELWSWVSGRPPKAPVAGVRMARYKMWFRPTRAIQELGLPQTPPQEALADAVSWFRAQKMAKG